MKKKLQQYSKDFHIVKFAVLMEWYLIFFLICFIFIFAIKHPCSQDNLIIAVNSVYNLRQYFKRFICDINFYDFKKFLQVTFLKKKYTNTVRKYLDCGVKISFFWSAEKFKSDLFKSRALLNKSLLHFSTLLKHDIFTLQSKYLLCFGHFNNEKVTLTMVYLSSVTAALRENVQVIGD